MDHVFSKKNCKNRALPETARIKLALPERNNCSDSTLRRSRSIILEFAVFAAVMPIKLGLNLDERGYVPSARFTLCTNSLISEASIPRGLILPASRNVTMRPSTASIFNEAYSVTPLDRRHLNTESHRTQSPCKAAIYARSVILPRSSSALTAFTP